jgi:hypothetical protein
MKFYVLSRFPRPDARSQKTTELPVIFTDRAEAQENCDVLNATLRKGEPGFIVEERETPGDVFGRSS